MQHNDEQTGLSYRERCQVIGIATGFILVLGFLTWLAIIYAFPATIVDEIPKYFRAGKIRTALGGCVALVFYVVGLPVGLTLSLLVILQGASGKRTRLTRWVLRAMSQRAVQKPHERTLNRPGVGGELPRTDKNAARYLPPAVGWAVFLAIVIGAIGVLVWAATSE